jgi:hypothetical protein
MTMIKTIQSLVSKLDAHHDGKLKGGFGMVRGGYLVLPANNAENCTNSGTICSGTNSGVCTNEINCSNTTNKTRNCTNNGTCFAM